MLECRYASSIYYNQENGYTVAVYETEDEIPEGKKEIGKQQFIAVGCELPRNEGLDISLKGQWKESERYGKQYHVASFEIQMPTTGEGVKAYLSLKEMHRIVNALPRDYKVPFSMHVSGFKYREIAERLGLPLGTVKSRIFFTRQKLQDELKDFI